MSPQARDIYLPLDQAIPLFYDVLRACRKAAPKPRWDDFPSLAMYSFMILTGDAVAKLLSAGTSEPTIPLLRSILECLFSLKYIHQEEYKLRSMCWLWGFIHHRIQLAEMADPESEVAMQLQHLTGEESSPSPRTSVRSKAVVQKQINGWRRLLEEPEMAALEKEAQERKNKSGGAITWHRLPCIPGTIAKMAKCVGMELEYKVPYRIWSATVHGVNARGIFFDQQDKNGEFTTLPLLMEAEEKQVYADIFLRRASGLMIRRFLSDSQRERLFNELNSTYWPQERQPEESNSTGDEALDSEDSDTDANMRDTM